MVCKTNNKNYYIVNFIAHVVTCYETIWQKVLLQFTSCVNWSEYYSNPSAPPLRETIDVWGRARRPPVLAPVQAGGGGRPQGEARRRYQSLLRAPPPVQAWVDHQRGVGHQEDGLQAVNMAKFDCVHQIQHQDIDAGRPRGAWAHRRSWLTCMASSMNKSKAMTRPNANCYEIKQPNNSTCILVNQKKGETYHVFWIK